MQNNFYNILEISKDSSLLEIKKSFKRLAHKYHPDKNFGDKDCEEKFKRILEAYEVLSDDEKREIYDLSIENDHGIYNNFKNESNPPTHIESINDIFLILDKINLITDL